MMNKLAAIMLSVCTLLSISCSKPSTSNDTPTVVLYTSADDEFVRLIVDEFANTTGIEVKVVGDTEATKTTGLVSRLKAEASNPHADVWWSSEPFGTIDLANNSILEPGAMRDTVSEDWPTQLHDPNWTWVGMGVRARVIVYAPDRVENPPTTMLGFAQPIYKGRIGIARPAFGTTRGHIGILAHQWGDDAYKRWVTMLKANNIRLYDGNASVVRAVAMGEIDLGLTDTDDVWAGQRNGWKVECIYETKDPPMIQTTNRSMGPTLLPNTVAIVQGAPNPDHAKTLAQFLVSERVETLLAESTSRNLPINPKLKELFTQIAPPSVNRDDLVFPDLIGALDRIEPALKTTTQILGP